MDDGKKKIYEGFGAFFYPPSQIYEIDLEQLPTISSWKRPIVINKKFSSNFRVIVTDDCFICPIGDNYKDSFDFLNILFAVFITKFYRAQIITKSDLCLTKWIQHSKYIEVNSNLSKSLRGLQESQREDDDTYNNWIDIRRQGIHKHLMELLLDQAVRFLNNKNFKNDLLIIGESGRMYNDDLFSISFLSSWIVVESIIEKIWSDFIKELKRTKSEKEALKNHHSWSVSHYVESLAFVEKLSQEGYECLTKLRKIRNDIIHRKKREVTKENAWNCLNVAICMLYNQLNQINPFEDVIYKKIKNS